MRTLGGNGARSLPWTCALLVLAACGGDDDSESTGDAGALSRADAGSSARDSGPSSPPGSAGNCTLPGEASAEDVSSPTTVVGTGSAASCTSQAFVAAVAKGGVITFSCGPEPHTITLEETAKIRNDAAQKVVIDGGGTVTLSGGGRRRILYMNTCDEALTWTTSHCDDQEFPQLTVQNIAFREGNAKSEEDGGGAIFARGGRLKIVNTRFANNVCADTGPDIGGAAVRVFDQYQDLPVYVVKSTFGGNAESANVCSNGAGLSSIGVSFSVYNSEFSYNRAIGVGQNPAKPGTPGGGSGGAIYNDGNDFTLRICGSTFAHNTANEGGGAIFYVSNDGSGEMYIADSKFNDNPSMGFETDGYPGIFVKTDNTIDADRAQFQ